MDMMRQEHAELGHNGAGAQVGMTIVAKSD
jgi:hypothetical protein